MLSYSCIILTLMLSICSNARKIPDEGSQSNNHAFQNGRNLAPGTVRETYTWNGTSLLIPGYSTFPSAGTILGWPSWPFIKYSTTSSGSSVPVGINHSAQSFQGTLDPLFDINVTDSELHAVNEPLNARASSTPLAVGIVNKTLSVNVANMPVRVNVSNIPLPVGVVNKTLAVKVENTPLPVRVTNSRIPVAIDPSVPLSAKVLNTLLPVGIVNETLPVKIDTPIEANIRGLPLPVGIVNASLPVRIENTPIDSNVINLPLPVGLVNATLPVTVQNDTLYTNITNLPLPVGIVNQTLAVDVNNLPLHVNVTNSALAVGIINQTLPVTLPEQPISVSVVNDSLPVEVTNSVLNTNLLNVPLPVEVVNTTLNVTVSNARLPVVITNLTLEVKSTMLLSGLTEVLNSMTSDLKRTITRKQCPAESSYGPQAPCRCIGTSYICYFNNIGKTRDDAMSFCKYLGFDGLVTYESLMELTVVGDIWRVLGVSSIDTFLWTSGIVKPNTRTFVWDPSGTSIDPSMWYPGEPNNVGGTENCVNSYMTNKALLNDGNCNAMLPFICEATNLDSFFN